MIPNRYSLMLPYLHLLADSREWHYRDMVEALAHQIKVNHEERQMMIPSGQKVFDYHVGFCRTNFRRYGLVEQARHGYVRITQKGTDVMGLKPDFIDISILKGIYALSSPMGDSIWN